MKSAGVIWVRRDVYRDPALPTNMKVLYVALLAYENADGPPSVETLARDTGLSVRMVRKALDDAMRIGLVTSVREDEYAINGGYVPSRSSPTPRKGLSFRR